MLPGASASFAEQIQHIGWVAAAIVGQAVVGKPLPPELEGDTTVYLHDKAKLRAPDRQVPELRRRLTLEKLTDEELVRDQRFAGGTIPGGGGT